MTTPGGKRLVNSKSGLKILCQHDKDASPWELAEPQWILDTEVETCPKCPVRFSFINRRHHCRRCGNIFCSKCCSSKVLLHRMAFVDPVRHCHTCANLTKEELGFFTEDIKVLIAGAPFHVVGSAPTPTTTPESPLEASESTEEFSLSNDVPQLFYCSITSDHRNLVFRQHDLEESGTEVEAEKTTCPDPIEIAKILDYHTLQDEKKQQVHTLKIRVKINAFEESLIKLESPAEPSRKPSLYWLSALCKGLGMIIPPKESS